MASNSWNLTYSDTLPSTAAVEVSNADHVWLTHGLQVKVSLRGPDAYSYPSSRYKVWGIDGVTSSGSASWVDMSARTTTITGTLVDTNEMQFVYAQFHDGGSNYDTVVSSGIAFDFDDPRLHANVEYADGHANWTERGYENAESTDLESGDESNIVVTLSKDNINQLSFHDLDMSGIRLYNDQIYATDGSELTKLLAIKASNHIAASKSGFSAAPYITYNDGSNWYTITDYNGNVASQFVDKIANVNYNAGTIAFDILEFSTYGFAELDRVEFYTGSESAGYIGTSIVMKAKVFDTLGGGVEDAPVTFSGSGDNIGTLVSGTVYTDAYGIATATLNVTDSGTATYNASVDDLNTDPDWDVHGLEVPAALGRSRFYQGEIYQAIYATEASNYYDDEVVDANTIEVAEPTTSGGNDPDYRADESDFTDTLQHDMNVLRTMLKQVKGTTEWYDDLGNYFDPTTTDSGNTENQELNLENIKGHTLDAHTILVAVSADNSGAGFATVSGNEGFLFTPTDSRYADWVDRRGLPIYQSSANSGVFADEGGVDEVCNIDLIDLSIGAEFKDASDNIIYAKFHDGEDHGGTGEGTDVYVKFYTSAGAYTWTENDPAEVMMVYPFRKVLTEMEEYEWQRTDFVNGFEGDTELIDDIANLWDYTGAGNNETTPTWDNTSGEYIVVSGTGDQVTAINALNTAIGGRVYGQSPLNINEDGDSFEINDDGDLLLLDEGDGTGGYIVDGDAIANSIDDLDIAIGALSAQLAASLGIKLTEELSSDILAGVEHTLPASNTYTPEDEAGEEGKNMEIWLDGQLLAASTGVGGINEDRDYAETSVSGITFTEDVYQYSNLIYYIKQQEEN